MTNVTNTDLVLKMAELASKLADDVHLLADDMVLISNSIKNMWERMNELEAKQFTSEHTKRYSNS